LIRRPSKVGVLRRRLGVSIRIGIVVVFVLSPLVLFVFILICIVATGLDIRVDIAFSISLRSIVLFIFVFLLVFVGIVVGFGWLFARDRGIRRRRRRRRSSRGLVVTDGRFGFPLLAFFVVIVGFLFVGLFGGFSSAAAANSEHSLQSGCGLVDLLVLRHSQMTACFLVFGFQTHWGDLVAATRCLMAFLLLLLRPVELFNEFCFD